MAWSEISLDDIEELTNTLEITNKKAVQTKNDDTNTQRNSSPSVKSTGVKESEEDEDDWDIDASDVQTDSEDEEHDEAEQDEDLDTDGEGDVTTRRSSERAKSERDVDRNRSDEAETVRRALAEAQRERDELQRQLSEAQTAQHGLRKTSLESQRDSLAGEIKTLKAQVRQAKESGDHEAETDLLLEIQKKQLRELAIESALEDVERDIKNPPKREQTKVQEQQQTQQTNVMPPEAQKFVKNNAWIATAPEAVRMTIVAQSQMMIDKGMDPNSPAFYATLANRLNKVLDGYEVKGGDAPTQRAKTEPTKKKGSPFPPKEQTTKVYRDENGNTKVVATKADKNAAERLGVDLKVYMRNKIEMEKATGGIAANWAPIKV